MEKYTLDRFVGDKAVLLLRSNESIEVIVHRHQLPKDVNEGDILEVALDDSRNVAEAKILKEETQSARKRAEALLQKILDKNK